MKTETLNRRNFLKKAAYTAPVVMSLGALSTPLNAFVVAPSNLITTTKNFEGPLGGKWTSTKVVDKTNNKIVSWTGTGPRGNSVTIMQNTNGTYTLTGPRGNTFIITKI